MKRTYASVEHAAHPGVAGMKPRTLTLKSSACWDWLVEDVQNVIVGCLDTGTKQCFAMTSWKEYTNWYNANLNAPLDKVFGHLIPDAPLCYLERCIRKCVVKKMEHEACLALAVATKRLDINDILACLIDTFFYNTHKDIVTEPAMFTILTKGFITSSRLDGFDWMDKQVWYKHAYDFHSKTKGAYFIWAAISGSIEATNYILKAFTDKYDNKSYIHYRFIRSNSCDDTAKPYDWKALFTSTPEWQSWFDEWKTDDTENGLQRSVASWFSRLSHRVDINFSAIISGLFSMWEQLSNELRIRIIETTGSQSCQLYEKAMSYADTTLPAKLLAMGFPKPTIVSSNFMTHMLLHYISREDTSVVDWLWSVNDLRMKTLDITVCKDLLGSITCFVKESKKEEIARAIYWLQNHPFDYSKSILNVLQSTTNLLALGGDSLHQQQQQQIARIVFDSDSNSPIYDVVYTDDDDDDEDEDD